MRTTIITLFTVVALIFTEGVCLAQKSARIEKEIEQIVITTFRLSPESKSVVDSLHQIAKTLGDARLLAYSDFLNKEWQWAYGAKTPEEKARFDTEIDDIANNSPYQALRAHSFLWKGDNLFKAKNERVKGLTAILKGKKLLEDAHIEQLPYVMDYYRLLMEYYFNFDDTQNAIHYAQLALQLPESDIFGRQSIYNELGMYYLRLKEYDKAQQAFYAGVEVCKKHNPTGKLSNWTAQEAMIRANLGILYEARGNYKAALPYFYEGLRNDEKDIPESSLGARIYIAYCLLHLDSIGKAREYMKLPEVEIPFWMHPAYDMHRFRLLALYNEKTGNFALAAHYKDSLMASKDSSRVRLDGRKLTILESSLQAQKYADERKTLENDRQWRNIIIVLLLIASAGIVFWLVQRHRQAQLLEAQKRRRAEEMLAAANQQLKQYLLNIKEKNQLIENISLQLDEAEAANRLSDKEKKQYLDNLHNSVLLTDEHWEEFKYLFEQVFPKFFTKLKEQYTELFPAEIRLLALEQLDLTDKEKGNMLNISADSVKKARYRLRKKYPDLLG